jgi:hypothetical protein
MFFIAMDDRRVSKAGVIEHRDSLLLPPGSQIDALQKNLLILFVYFAYLASAN